MFPRLKERIERAVGDLEGLLVCHVSVLTSQPPCSFSRGQFEADEDGVGVGGKGGSGDGEGEASCRGGEGCYGLMDMEMEMEMDWLGG